jgi:NADPH-dependent F420 reductase
MTEAVKKIGVLGGTGQEGSGLAFRWAAAGHQVGIGGRTAEKANSMADELNGATNSDRLHGGTNAAIAAWCEIAVLTVPFAAQRETALSVRDSLVGKILIDVTVPLVPPKVARVQLPAGGSAVAALQEELGPEVKMVSAFQNISAWHLRDLGHDLDCDVLICGNDPGAREVVVGLARDAGLRGIHAGMLVNSAATEALTSVLISINQRYKIPASGIRITGLGEP